MNATDFLSGESCIVLPTKANPRVYLAINSRKTAKQAYMLYNPFSKKAKLLKVVTRFLSVYCNHMAKLLLPTVKVAKSDFISFLEKRLKKEIISSVYIATAKDKVVLQLQDSKDIVGYVKYPISSIGKKRLLNEHKAITTLSKINLVFEVLVYDSYKGTPFIILQNLKGTIGNASQKEYNQILDSLKKEKSFRLNSHPRILDIKNKLKLFELFDIMDTLEILLRFSKLRYLEVFEHGDFAPWNLIRTEKGVIPFDFEYFEEQGLEHMDELKYHFQIENLLHGRKGKALIEVISSNVTIKEFDLIFKIFLIKEIVNKYGVGESYALENTLLKY